LNKEDFDFDLVNAMYVAHYFSLRW